MATATTNPPETRQRRRLTPVERAERNDASLERATCNVALSNYPAIYAGFREKGIVEAEIIPRVNILTYGAWQALGRQVRKGEHGVKIVTWLESSKLEYDKNGKEKAPHRFPRTSKVFHISQTDPITA